MTTTTTGPTPPSSGLDHDAIVVGAGFSGLYTLHKLREAGLRVHVLERGAGVGGTWYWNRYPGLQCDTETISYSFTFDPELYRGWTWSRRFAPQAEILEYANYLADRLDLRRDITFGANVVAAELDDATTTWRVRLDDGRELTCRYLVGAPGPLSSTNVPRLPGLEHFAGEVHHTGTYPHEPLQYEGKRVAVIGTGSSGVQLICALAPQVAELVVFQRTPQYITPAQQKVLDAETVQHRKDNLDELVHEMRHSAFGAPGTSTNRSAFEHTPAERDEVFQAAWEYGAQAFALATYNDLTTNLEANEMAADFVRRKITQIVEDPETARKLQPDYLFGTKRPIKADGYYETFNRDNVDLVWLSEEPVVEVTPTGIRTAEREFEFDMILFATGFDAITGPLFGMNITGRGGLRLRDKWQEGVEVRTYLGVATSEFPNLFLIQGPQSPSVMANFIFGIQVNVDFVAGLIARLHRDGGLTAETTPAAETEWADYVQGLVEQTLLLKTPSWWNGSNIAEKPRPAIFQSFTGGVNVYADKCDELAAADYPGFEFAAALEPAH